MESEQMKSETQISQITGAVKVKEAVLLKIGKDKHVLMHYGTEILELVNGEVILCAAKTQSSIRAVNQVMKYFGSSKTAKEIKRELNSTGRVHI